MNRRQVWLVAWGVSLGLPASCIFPTCLQEGGWRTVQDHHSQVWALQPPVPLGSRGSTDTLDWREELCHLPPLHPPLQASAGVGGGYRGRGIEHLSGFK